MNTMPATAAPKATPIALLATMVDALVATGMLPAGATEEDFERYVERGRAKQEVDSYVSINGVPLRVVLAEACK
jgi:hypothetical protein